LLSIGEPIIYYETIESTIKFFLAELAAIERIQRLSLFFQDFLLFIHFFTVWKSASITGQDSRKSVEKEASSLALIASYMCIFGQVLAALIRSMFPR